LAYGRHWDLSFQNWQKNKKLVTAVADSYKFTTA